LGRGTEMRIGQILTKQAFICVLLLLNSCGPSKPNVDEKEFLNAVEFTKPISVVVQLDQFTDSYGRVQSSDNTNLIAFLANAGFIGILPQTSAAPWWHFNVSGGALENEQFTVLLGERVVTNHSDEKSWSEGAIQYYAETITYSIQLEQGIKSATNAQFNQNSFRLVLMNDPAVGRWQAIVGDVRGTTFNNSDSAAITRELAIEGGGFLNNLVSKISQAITQSSDQIEQQLASQGVIARGREPGVVTSKNGNLAFYTTGASFDGRSLGDIDTYCQALKIGSYRNWRWPTRQELGVLVSANGVLIDTPDRRFWRILTTVGPDQIQFHIPTNTFVDNGGTAFNLANLNGDKSTAFYWLQELQINQNGTGGFMASPASLRNTAQVPLGGDARVICAADLN
jgi:hypothetical protein